MCGLPADLKVPPLLEKGKPVGADGRVRMQGGPEVSGLVGWLGSRASGGLLDAPSEAVPGVTATPGGMSEHPWAATN